VSLIPSIEFLDATKEFNRLLESLSPGPYSEEWFAQPQTEAWNALREGGWLLAGGAGSRDEELTNLLELAEVWGQHLIPLPFSATLCLMRWANSSDQPSVSPLTLAVPTAGGSAIAPFANIRGVEVVCDVELGLTLSAGKGTSPDIFAPSMPIAVVDRASIGPQEWLCESIALFAAEAVGAARQCHNRALAYSFERSAYQQVIGSFQAIHHMAANMYRDLELAKSASLWAANAGDLEEALRAGTMAAELARSVAQKSIQVHGGIGFTWELGLHWYLRHVMAVESFFRHISLEHMREM
jgi:hypothetical protein